MQVIIEHAFDSITVFEFDKGIKTQITATLLVYYKTSEKNSPKIRSFVEVGSDFSNKYII